MPTIKRRKAPKGWVVKHPQYGVWYLSREAVVADWKVDRKKAYFEEAEREPSDEEVETWFREQMTWVEIHRDGVQMKRPDMIAWEKSFYQTMTRDTDTLDPEAYQARYRSPV